ncbi:hypothetical protein, partial [Enterobacter hormaechei]|uniref:hypothetical protein n=1 Tax=Enterobacter hormaechei TaxID=158836 RepID=UPI0013D52D19
MSRTVVIHADHFDPVALRALATGVSAVHIDELVPVMKDQPWPEVLRVSPGAHLESLFRGANVVNRVFSLEG